MQIPILSGIYSKQDNDLRVGYPVNMLPIALNNGISTGYIRPAYGITLFTDTDGIDRGGVYWPKTGGHYRVIGMKLRHISTGVSTNIGTITGIDRVTFDYSFDKLAIAADGKLYLSNGTTVSQVTDADLGRVIDVCWIGGYFVTTDGQYIVVTDLNDPTSINPLKYGSSEVDPDNVVAVKRIRNELIVVNRHTIETFRNIGGQYFPFQRVEGAVVSKGAVSTHAVCTFKDSLLFVGSGRNEPLAVYMADNSNAIKLSTQEIDDDLSKLTQSELDSLLVEYISYRDNQFLLIHLPTKTYCYNHTASQELKVPVWSILHSDSRYKCNGFIWDGEKLIGGDPTSNRLGYLTPDNSLHYGTQVAWELKTQLLYPDGKRAIIDSLELLGVWAKERTNTTISTCYTNDGITWSQSKSITILSWNNDQKRLVWFKNGLIQNWRIQKFFGRGATVSIMRLDASLTPLVY